MTNICSIKHFLTIYNKSILSVCGFTGTSRRLSGRFLQYRRHDTRDAKTVHECALVFIFIWQVHSRREHLSAEDIKKNKALMQNLTVGNTAIIDDDLKVAF